jgi:hypothetical protein
VPSGSTTAVATASAEIFDPASNTFTTTGAMSYARVWHLAVPLPSGDVLVAGGCSTVQSQARSTEIYRAATGAFVTGPIMLTPHCAGQATVLNSGQILFSGGWDSSAYGTVLTGSEVFDPTSNSFTAVGAMVQPRYTHSATLLQNGQVLLAGGLSATDFLTSTEYYDPVAKTFSAGPGNVPSSNVAVQLSSGAPMIVGDGYLETISNSNTVSSIGLVSERDGESAIALKNGSLLLVGGGGGNETADIVTFGVPVPANPAPSLSEIDYSNAAIFSGYDFQAGAKVLVDGVTASVNVVTSSDQIQCSTPGAGVHTFQVQNPDGQLSNILRETF